MHEGAWVRGRKSRFVEKCADREATPAIVDVKEKGSGQGLCRKEGTSEGGVRRREDGWAIQGWPA